MTLVPEVETDEEGQKQTTKAQRLELERLQPFLSGFRPYFTCVVATAQLSMFIWMCWTTTFAEIGLSPTVYQRIEPNTFRGNVTVTHTRQANPLVGPTGMQLVSLGALFPPCIREDHALNVRQVQTLNPRHGEVGGGLGCCEVPQLNLAGTVTKEECSVLSNGYAYWRPTRCSQRSPLQSVVQHILRPCCGELDGQCTLSSPQLCWFVNGRFHVHAEHCTEVDCLQELCVFGEEEMQNNYETEFSPRQSTQWWRFVSSIYLHQGILDCFLITPIQIWVLWGQENSQGWLRMALLHHTAGVGGHLIGSLFTKHVSPQAGAGPAVGGVIGLALVEHVILWPLIKEPKRRLALLLGCLFLLLAIGTLPHVNNFSLIAGLLYGFLFALLLCSSYVFQRKVVLFQVTIVFFIIAMFVFSVFLFYAVQRVHIRSFFRHINCIPYAQGLCD